MEGRFTYATERWFPKPPASVWPFVADTTRLNELVGFAAYQVSETLDEQGRLLRRCRGKVGPLMLRWEERFGEWELNARLVQKRSFLNGPIREVITIFTLAPDGNGTRLAVAAEVLWHGLFGALLSRQGRFAPEFDRRAGRLARMIEESSGTADEVPGLAEGDRLEPRACRRLAPLLGALAGNRAAHGLADRLADLLARAPVAELRSIRPFALARMWGVPPEQAVELCLAAHQAGILALGWDLLCPRCRGAKTRVARLDELPTESHCGSCNIDYGRNFSRNVELTFRPEPWLRPLPEGEFCMLGPSTTPHIVLQRQVEAGASETRPLELAPGLYRYRTAEPGAECDVEIGPDGELPDFAVLVDGAIPGPGRAKGSIRLANRTGKPLFFVVESRDWSADALTGERVIAMPAFRRLCPEQLLRPGDDVAIQRITILFTDLQGSTTLYSRLGDSSAFRLVRDHFAFLAERIQRHHGFVVKTVGDAVMAAFHDPVEAVRAAIAIQDEVAAFNRRREDGGIVLKLGLHAGACIAITAGGLLDYFGTTVNIASRLEHHCGGGEAVISAALLADEAVREILAGRAHGEESTELRGVPERVNYVRLFPPVPVLQGEWSGVGRRSGDKGPRPANAATPPPSPPPASP